MSRATRRDVLRKVGLAGSLIGVPGIAGALVNRAEAAQPDPIFAAIEAHRRLFEAGNAMDGAAGTEALDAAGRSEMAALQMVLRTVPTTGAGMLAYVNHLQGHMGFGQCLAAEHEFDAILATVRQFASARAV